MSETTSKKDPYDKTATTRSTRRRDRIAEAGGGSVLVRFQTADALGQLDRLVDAGLGASRPQALLNLVAERADQKTLNLYRWDTDVGEILAYAPTIPDARTQVMATLAANDAARDELENAIAGKPEIVTGEAAFVAWHN